MANELERIVYPNGNIEYRLNGLVHREDGPARISAMDDIKQWFINGKLHRDDGPAVINKGAHGTLYYAWYWHGILHRKDGPAIIYPETNGLQWWLHSSQYESFEKWLKANNEIDEEDKTLLKLEYG